MSLPTSVPPAASSAERTITLKFNGRSGVLVEARHADLRRGVVFSARCVSYTSRLWGDLGGRGMASPVLSPPFRWGGIKILRFLGGGCARPPSSNAPCHDRKAVDLEADEGSSTGVAYAMRTYDRKISRGGSARLMCSLGIIAGTTI